MNTMTTPNSTEEQKTQETTGRDVNFHQKLKVLAGSSYLKKLKTGNNDACIQNLEIDAKDKQAQEKEEFSKFAKENNVKIINEKNEEKGFHAKTYEIDGKIVIAFRGTEKTDLRDLAADAKMWLLRRPSVQHQQALDYYNKMVNELNKDPRYKGKEIILTGHSLGGSLAQYVSYHSGKKAVTFCPFGMGIAIRNENRERIRKEPEKEEEYKRKDAQKFEAVKKNIINYGNEGDPIYMINIKNQLGETLVIENEDNFFKDGLNHKLRLMGNLRDAVPYNPAKHRVNVVRIKKLWERECTKENRSENISETDSENRQEESSKSTFGNELKEVYNITLNVDKDNLKDIYDEEEFFKKLKQDNTLNDNFETFKYTNNNDNNDNNNDNTNNTNNITSNEDTAAAINKLYEEMIQKEKEEEFLKYGSIENKDPDRIITYEELIKYIYDENKKFNKDDSAYLQAQARKGNVFWESSVRDKISSGEVYVREYTRRDGTHVDAYYRRYPSC